MIYDIGTMVFQDWQIVDLIGEGSFGKVYEIRKTSGGITTTSALKVITIPQSQSDMRNTMSEVSTALVARL